MPGLLVRNGDPERPRIGIDWRAVAAIGALTLSLFSALVFLLNERIVVLAHVAKGEAMIAPVQNHIDNIGPYKHLDPQQLKDVLAMQYDLRELRKAVARIERRMGITDE